MKPRVDFARPIQTRGGRPARVLCTDAGGPYPVVALIAHPDGSRSAAHFTVGGCCFTSGETHHRDLVNVPPVVRNVRLWVVIDSSGNVKTLYYIPASMTGLLACKEVTITITEGEGV